MNRLDAAAQNYHQEKKIHLRKLLDEFVGFLAECQHKFPEGTRAKEVAASYTRALKDRGVFPLIELPDGMYDIEQDGLTIEAEFTELAAKRAEAAGVI